MTGDDAVRDYHEPGFSWIFLDVAVSLSVAQCRRNSIPRLRM